MNPRSILLIDSDEDSLTVYSALLKHVGYRVVMARGPEEGIRLAREGPPDLIFTDLFRRTDEGWYTIDEIRSDPVMRAIPIVVLTARVLREDRRRAIAAGCSEFLMKPLQPSEAVAVAARLLGQPRPGQAQG